MPTDLIPFISANLATVPIVSLLYGAFVVLAITSLALGLHRACKPSPTVPKGNKAALRKARLEFFKKPLTMGSIILFMIVTAHWINTFIRLFDAFVNFQDGKVPVVYYGDLSRTSNIVRSITMLTSLIVCDSMIIYRLYIVWSYNKVVIIFPTLSLIGLITCTIGIVCEFTKFVPGMDVFVSAAGRWITNDGVFTLMQSTISIHPRTYNSVRLSFQFLTWAIAFLISYELHSNLQFPIVDIAPAAAGISFMLINLRIGLGWAQQAAPMTAGSLTRIPEYGRYQLRSLAVNISCTVEDRLDSHADLENQDLSCGMPRKNEIGIIADNI
ncbi:hypothetical protein C8J56DRAFT_766933 [Mycena floridula]|nr:hypothetical protein C8J56DRAFT_766933 [Mycena floridula]